MNTEKKKRNAGSKIAIIVIIVYLLLPLVMTLIYSLFQEWIDVMPTGFTLGAYTELFTDPLFWKAVGRTVIISIVPIVLCTVFVLLAMYVVVVYHPEWDKMIQILMYDSVCNPGRHPSNLRSVALQQCAGTFRRQNVHACCDLYGCNPSLCISGNQK